MARRFTWPKCSYCGTLNGVYPCKICGILACNECTTIHISIGAADNMDVDFYCEHENYKLIESDNWQTEEV